MGLKVGFLASSVEDIGRVVLSSAQSASRNAFGLKLFLLLLLLCYNLHTVLHNSLTVLKFISFKRQALALLPKLASNSWVQKIFLP